MSLVLLFTDYKNAPIVKIEPILPNEPIRILYPFQQLLTHKGTHQGAFVWRREIYFVAKKLNIPYLQTHFFVL